PPDPAELMLDLNWSSEQGGDPAAPRVHQQSHDYRHKDGAPVSPWAEVLGRIQACDADGTARLVAQLDAADRREIATELPGYLQQLRRGRWAAITRQAHPVRRGSGCVQVSHRSQVV
ncbi:hypothetical protein, partial [Microbispora sp. H10836]|uniref:hypothetical protein n=1 Tax=Microbispora sp. H10836 TaxID=2729106 RepID=UPI001B8C17C5